MNNWNIWNIQTVSVWTWHLKYVISNGFSLSNEQSPSGHHQYDVRAPAQTPLSPFQLLASPHHRRAHPGAQGWLFVGNVNKVWTWSLGVHTCIQGRWRQTGRAWGRKLGGSGIRWAFTMQPGLGTGSEETQNSKFAPGLPGYYGDYLTR